MRHPSTDAQDGFSLVEVLVAAFILVVGILSALTLLDTANSATNLTSARIAATNLAREVSEQARAVDYDRITAADLPAGVQGRMGGGTANPFTVTRRNTVFTVKLSTCVYDDPHDGLADATSKPTDGGLSWCATTAPQAGAPAEVNPDDFRRVTVEVSWTYRGNVRRMVQSVLVVNPSGGLGPRIKKFYTEPPGQITGGAGGSTLTYTVETDPAASVRWTVDGTSAGAQAAPVGALPARTWTVNWNLGTYGTNPFVVDGIYRLSVQAFNSQGIAGDQRVMTIPLNRTEPLAVMGAGGGRNTQFGGIVDIAWAASPERDVIGYQVQRQNGDGTWSRVCPATVDYRTRLTCTDPNPPAGTARYRVFALDRADILDGASTPRLGTPVPLSIGAPGPAPPKPENLTVTYGADGKPVLRWTQPSGGTVQMFRIYRDGNALTDRYSAVPGNVLEFTDTDPGGIRHVYLVSAVDPSYNESRPSSPAL